MAFDCQTFSHNFLTFSHFFSLFIIFYHFKTFFTTLVVIFYLFKILAKLIPANLGTKIDVPKLFGTEDAVKLGSRFCLILEHLAAEDHRAVDDDVPCLDYDRFVYCF